MKTYHAKVWQVQGFGEYFLRRGRRSNVEVSGFVRAEGPDDAWRRVIEMARDAYPEISQIDDQSIPRAVLNCDEIEDASALDLAPEQIDRIEVYWDDREG